MDNKFPSKDILKNKFREIHESLEKIYEAPGVWKRFSGKKHLAHNTAFPMEAYAYACLYLEVKDIYRQRVKEACDRLLAEQTEEGVFFCYHFSDNPLPFDGGAFAHGSASEALLLGYRVLDDKRYLDAARRAFDAYRLYPYENNHNYAAFALWHISELYRLTGDKELLKKGVFYAENCVIRGIGPSGAHDGHNYYSEYGDIVLKGMAKFLEVLPQEHSFYPVLKDRVIRYVNQMLCRQQKHETIAVRNRKYLGMNQGTNERCPYETESKKDEKGICR